MPPGGTDLENSWYMTQLLSFILNFVRGALIGLAELVPGVSGGTVALITGIYEKALYNGNLLLDLVRDRTKAAVRRIDWGFLLAVGVGMLGAVFTMATAMDAFITGYPQVSRGLFLGMVLTSLIVPVGMIDRRDLRKRWPVLIPVFLVSAVIAFLGTGFTSAPQNDPSLIVVFFAGMVAVCALVLPGLSGSFLLLAFGLYQPIIAAVSDRRWAVIFTFAIGALIGISAFVRILQHLMTNHRTLTLTAMAGLMAGSLRALWPWQSDSAQLLAPADNVGTVAVAFLIGAAVVAALIVADRLRQNRTSTIATPAEPKGAR